jgi:YfiH family protein
MMFELALPGARALFTTRAGGLSEHPYHSRNLGLKTEDDAEIVRANIEQLKSELGLSRLQLLEQVHGNQIAEISARTDGEIPIADGATTKERHAGVMIAGADCPPVFLASTNRLTALHCGWRSVSTGIIEQAAHQFVGESFEAAIGPGICMDHFEVGPEVIDAMGADGEAHSSGRQLDLIGVISARLKRVGASSVHCVDRCTYCEPEHFYSHRRDNGVTGRQAGVAWRI